MHQIARRRTIIMGTFVKYSIYHLKHPGERTDVQDIEDEGVFMSFYVEQVPENELATNEFGVCELCQKSFRSIDEKTPHFRSVAHLQNSRPRAMAIIVQEAYEAARAAALAAVPL
jgi:hypothetical protein